MGMYTDFYYTLFLKDVSDEMMKIFEAVNVTNVDFPKKLPKHKFFKCSRWENVFGDNMEWNSNWQDVPGGVESSRIIAISGHSNFKDYDSEIDNFMDWIGPHIVGGGAWSHYEGNVWNWQVDYHYGLNVKEEMVFTKK